MGNKRNFAALDWVLGEISDTLNEARQSLEAYVEDPKDSTRIRFCLTHIHQVHGSLQMVEFHGAALLAEEMEHTAQAIMDNSVSSLPEAQEVLMRGLLQLPIFLDHVRSAKDDNPVRIMPLLNDLRAVRKQSYLSETNLFSPDLSAAQKVEGQRHAVLDDASKFQQVLKKLREMYQFAAASVLRGIKVDENLDYLDKVLSRLDLMTRGTQGHATWEVAAALVGALKQDELDLSVAVRGLLRYISRELRILGEKGVSALDAPARESLLKNMLYYISRSRGVSEKAQLIKQKYQLDGAMSSGQSGMDAPSSGPRQSDDVLQAPDADAIRSVVVALQDELGNVKRQLDLSLESGGDAADIKEVLPLVKRVADTLAVLGIGDLRKQMLDQSARLEELSEANSVDPQALMQTAGKIIEIEHRLQAIGKSAGKTDDLSKVNEREVEIDAAKASVVKECAEGLLRAKDSIIEYISSQWDKGHLENVGHMLNSIRGGLNMIPLRRPAAIVKSCALYIQEQLLEGQEHPSFQALESLADAMASVEYYLERLMEDMHDGTDAMLDIAEESVASLGYPIEQLAPTTEAASEEPLATPEVEESDDYQVDQEDFEHAASGSEADVEESALYEAPEDHERQDEVEHSQAADLESEQAGAEPESAPEPEYQSELGDQSDLEAEQSVDAESEEASAALAEESEQTEPEEPEVESDIDDEIIEIFIEEAGEVLDTLHEYYPKWKEDENDQDALVIVRRAFHTLKGSGRMVEAYDMGELAWSVENMLNRVIDRTIKLQPEVFNLADAVIDIIPTLVKAFENKKANPIKDLTEKYQTWGHEISDGKFPEELSESQPAFSDTEEQDGSAAAENEQAPSAPPASADEHVDDDDVDTVLQEIFSQESITHLETVDAFIQQAESEAPIYGVPSDDLQRALHTLKGSAKMAQVWPIAEITEPLEHFAKELIAFQVRINDDILQLIKDAAQYTRDGLDQIERGEKVEIPQTAQFTARTKELRDLAVGHMSLSKENAPSETHKVDPRMLSLVMAEEVALLLDADQFLARWQETGSVADDIGKLMNELKVLGEGARQAHLPGMAELSSQLRDAHQNALDGRLTADDNFFDLMRRGHDALLDMVDAVAAGQNAQGAPSELTAELVALNESAGFESPQGAVSDEEASADDSVALEEITFDDDDDETADVEISFEDDEISYDELPELEASFESADQDDLPEAPEETDQEEQAGEESSDSEADYAEFDMDMATDSEAEVPDVESDDYSESEADEEPQSAPEIDPSAVEIPAGVDESKVVKIPGLIDQIDVASEDYDGDIIEVFLEEADELVEGLDEAIHAWETNWSDTDSLEEIKRILHTLKGGARLSGMENLGALTHDYESMLIDMGEDLSGVDDKFFATVHGYQDSILNAVKAVKLFMSGDYELGLVDQGDAPEISDDAVKESGEQSPATSAPDTPQPASDEPQGKTNVVQFGRKPAEKAAADFSMPTVSGGGTEGGGQAVGNVAIKKSGPQEVVKVSAELLEELVNLAGETSINRSRLEQYVTDFSFAIDEIDGTLSRLQDQLRRLDIETEAQVLFRQEQMEALDDFDPLEMDRYSNLQQLSRSLIESASDLTDLKADLSDRVRQTETLLLQQSRVNTTLQEGLMRSRMVPFSRMVPRLRRIVRQVSTELGKNVSFELDNVEGELDRSMLERMVSPLEHMLRNAVDHGIESPEDRIAAGKEEQGRIVLTLAREGGDVIIRLADNGRGVNLKRVREKAIERELMAPDADLSDYDIMQFILHAGFSTAENITQISGRGVGMDVVNAEIKQLGGSVVINSSWGKGTEFVVRLPFTLSVNRALMVAIGYDHYAVPLSSIEGIVRISPFELEHYYANPEAQFEYANEQYHVRYLGGLLGSKVLPKLEGQILPLPVLLVRSAEHMMALHVDAVMGSREIVVKSLGQQFSAVPGLSGATVMGDGSVVVILDPHALVRQEIAKATMLQEQKIHSIAQSDSEPEDDRVRKIMVVDDSVTVRKVTTRFLEREGYEVMTAKDGMDAIQVLQEELPDLMLLDIEMPRMDGFEVAKTVRNTQRWEHLPIIMITSRTGDKHRDHAMSLGVDKYLGKPYQEDVLIEAIGEVLESKSEHGS